ncbi:hypothetical protein STXM2123_2541 [Streptomyces sp. F-3]|nr:hypothetical protein STXM2123_2541 [Streptomyces sp. F-3]
MIARCANRQCDSLRWASPGRQAEGVPPSSGVLGLETEDAPCEEGEKGRKRVFTGSRP